MYDLDDMLKDSIADARIKDRIRHLVDVKALRIMAVRPGEEFVARSGGEIVSRHAVISLHVLPGRDVNDGATVVVVDDAPADYIQKIADLLSSFGNVLKNY